MKKIELVCIAAVLCAGSVVGFTSARWGAASHSHANAGQVAGRAVPVKVAKEQPLEVALKPARSEVETLASIRQDKLRSRRLVALDRFYDGLDAEGARRALDTLPLGEEGDLQEVRSQLIVRWAELEPEAAAVFAQAKMRGLLGEVLDVWGTADREAAKSFVANIRDRDLLLEILPGFTRTLAEGDFEDALRFATALPADQFQNSVRLAFLALAGKNPASAAARALAMPEDDTRGSAMSAVVQIWLEKDPQAAMAWVMQRPDTPSSYMGSLFDSAMVDWSTSDPAAAGRFVRNLPAGKQRENAIQRVAQMWSFKDMNSALQWVQSLPQDEARTQALGSVLNRWSYEDPAAAAAFLSRQPASAKTGKMLTNLGRNWANVDPAAAIAWAAGQQNEALEKSVAQTAFGQLAADNPAAALAGLRALRGAEARAGAIAEIAKSWAERDVNAAGRWALALPPADANSDALVGVIETGTAKDPVAMAGWLGTIKTHPQRDAAVEVFARVAQQFDPLTAAQWANTLADATKRQPLVQKIVRGYANYDAPAARQWVLGQAFNSEERTALLGQISEVEPRK